MKNILIIKLSALGDVLMALSVVEPLKRQDPGIKLTWVCGKAVESLVRSNPFIDEVVVADEFKILKGSWLQRIPAIIQLWKAIGNKKFSKIFIGQSDKRYLALALPWCGRSEIKLFAPAKGKNHIAEYFNWVGLSEHSAKPYHPPSTELPTKVQDKLGSKPLIMIAPGGAKNVLAEVGLKRWPLPQYVELAQRLHAEGYQIGITGADSDAWIRPFLPDFAIDFLGLTNPLQTIELLRKAKLVVTHDTGVLHMSASSGVPTVALFGPTPPTSFFWKGNPSSVCLWGGKNLACRPCYDGKRFADCSNNLCMQALTTDFVYKACQTALSGQPSTQNIVEI